MGDVRVPADAKWQAQTQRAVENFPISGMPIERALIGALASIKGAAAMVNARLKVIPKDVAEAIHAAATEVASGGWDDHFPVDVFQTGSGTSSNMNANEVIATLAGEGVHANDDVNMGQSSNDVFPSAVHLAALDEITNDLLPAMERLQTYVWRRHLAAAAGRAMAGSDETARGVRAVGFADIVSFTRLTRRLTDAELGQLIERFEGMAADVVALNGGRVIKSIGDEVLIADNGCGLHAGRDTDGLGLGLALISQMTDGFSVVGRSSGGTELRLREHLGLARAKLRDRFVRSGPIPPARHPVSRGRSTT
jgi:hypothetical protein